MKNLPKKIYLQVLTENDELSQEEIEQTNFNELSEVSWCADRIFDSDIEYILANRENDAQFYHSELSQLAIESKNRDLQLAKLEAEVIQLQKYRKDLNSSELE